MYKIKDVGAHDCAQKGITLIALVITIIIMLILVAVTISMAVNGGLFEYAGKATGDTKNAIDQEQALASGKIKVGNTWYDSIDDYLNNIPSGTQGDGTTEGDGEDIPVWDGVDPYEGQEARYTFEIGKDNPADVKAYLYLKENGNYDIAVRGTGEIMSFGEASECGGYNSAGSFAEYVLDNVYITKGVTSIGESMFCNRSLMEVKISDTVTRVEGGAFSWSTVSTAMVLPESVEYLGVGSFCGFSGNLTVLGAVELGNGAFGAGTDPGLVSIRIKEGVKEIPDHTLEGCASLKSITIPISVTSVGISVHIWRRLEVNYGGSPEDWALVNGSEWLENLASMNFNYIEQ